MSSASSSTTSLVSNTTVSSRAPLTGTQPKYFQAAFASLQSTYGFAGSVPMPAPKTTASSVMTSRMSSMAVSSHVSSATPKDFQSAFADLQSTYGFSGSVPSPVPAPQNRGGRGSLFSKLARVAFASPKPRASTSPTHKIRHVPRPSPHMTLL
ncbi:hypothetical protein DFH07DRAFT_392561 [Mycena maculata]|uniref:Uncharacterized protein n=1 Tax=Mycena maculata TaxID=230809 RepID=A0AAD7KB97_9AGAR|nr:hypothetical protein DFH07DRAFT_392561 [Mycena maculata]